MDAKLIGFTVFMRQTLKVKYVYTNVQNVVTNDMLLSEFWTKTQYNFPKGINIQPNHVNHEHCRGHYESITSSPCKRQKVIFTIKCNKCITRTRFKAMKYSKCKTRITLLNATFSNS
jgi:hypothetical protein